MYCNLRHILLVAMAVVCCVAHAQKIHWLETTHDFGTFQDTEGKQSYGFKFVNVDSQPVAINNVRTSCGCTATNYSHDDVMPGDTAVVTVTYDPLGMMGRFEKTAKVYMGADNKVYTLYITGKVLTDGRHMAAKYPYQVGALHLTRDSVWFGDVVQGTGRNEYIHAFNSSTDTLSLGWQNDSRNLLISASGTKVEPGDLVTFSVYYNSIGAVQPGPDLSGFTLLVDNERHPEWRLFIPAGANVVQPQQTLSQESLSNAPLISYDPMLIDLGKVKANKSVNIKFKLTNEGNSTLELYRIYTTDLASSCPLCPIKNFRVDHFPERVKPGKTVEIKGKLWLDELTLLGQGAFNLMIEVKSNDPRNPRIIGNVHITGQVVK